MESLKDPIKQPATLPRYLTDAELAPIIRTSKSWLQKDRITAKRIPFIKLGDRCLYDLDKVLQAIEAHSVGGSVRRAGRRGAL